LQVVEPARRRIVFRTLRNLLVEALGVIALAAFLGEQAGLIGWLIPLVVLAVILVLGKGTGRENEEPRQYEYPARFTPDEWLDDAHASYARGTHISTLAVRYDVEPEWLEEQFAARASAGGAR
jgi:hypothetical protein